MSKFSALQAFAGDDKQIVPKSGGGGWQIVAKSDAPPPAAAKTQLTPEELEAKLTYINEMVPHRTQMLMGSQAGSGSGDFHQYRSSRRREQNRLYGLDQDEKKKDADVAFESRKRERETAEAAKEAKRAKKRDKKKQRKQKKKGPGARSTVAAGGAGAEGQDSDDESASGDEKPAAVPSDALD